jgi:hypothetical protein
MPIGSVFEPFEYSLIFSSSSRQYSLFDPYSFALCFVAGELPIGPELGLSLVASPSVP